MFSWGKVSTEDRLFSVPSSLVDTFTTFKLFNLVFTTKVLFMVIDTILELFEVCGEEY